MISGGRSSNECQTSYMVINFKRALDFVSQKKNDTFFIPIGRYVVEDRFFSEFIFLLCYRKSMTSVDVDIDIDRNIESNSKDC